MNFKKSATLLFFVFLQINVCFGQWTPLLSDPAGDGSSANLLDVVKLDYQYDSEADYLWFRLATSEINESQAMNVGVNIMTGFGNGFTAEESIFTFWGGANNLLYSRILTAWVTGTAPDNYSGILGTAGASGADSNQFEQISNDVSIEVNVNDNEIIIGVNRADLIPNHRLGTNVTIAAAVGSSTAWNDNIFDSSENTTITIADDLPAASIDDLPSNPSWTNLLSDVSGDNATNLLDAVQLDYFYEPALDSLWFKMTTSEMSSSQAMNFSMTILSFYTQNESAIVYDGDNQSFYNRALTIDITGNPPNDYSGTMGVSEAQALWFGNYGQYTDALSVDVNVDDNTIIVGLRRKDLIPDYAMETNVEIAGTMSGATVFDWSDSIYDPTFSSTINISEVSSIIDLCAGANVGTLNGAATYCFNETAIISASEVTIPTEGTSGIFWTISSQDISTSSNPLAESSLISVAPYSGEYFDFEFATNSNNLAPGSYFVNAFVFANADEDGSLAGIDLNSACIVSSGAFLIELQEDYPSLAVDVEFENTTNGLANGLINASVTGGTGDYSYSWSNGESVASLNELEAGAYTLTISDNSGCLESITETVVIGMSTSIADWVESGAVNIYPTGTSGIVNLEFNLPDFKEIELAIVSNAGKRVESFTKHTSSQDRFEIDLSELLLEFITLSLCLRMRFTPNKL